MTAQFPMAALLFAIGVAAQQPATLVVVVRDPSGQPVAGATGRIECDAEQSLAALAGLPAGRHGSLAPTTTATGTSDENGVLRFPVAAEPRAGTGIVTTQQGLGALVGRLRPGEAQRLTLAPMAEVTTATGSEEFTLWARSTTDTGDLVLLAPLRGTHVRLPAGNYEIWARNQDGWIWQRLHARSGQRVVVQFVGSAQRVRSRASAWVHPAAWPALPLVEPGGECVLLGTALAAPLTAGVPAEGLVLADRTLPLPPTAEPMAWPPIGAAPVAVAFGLADAAGPEAATAELFSLRRTAGGTWQVLGAARLDAAGRFTLPEPGDGDVWLLLTAKGHAPAAHAWSAVRPGTDLTLQRGLPLVVHATTAGNDPAGDRLVEEVPEDGEAATVHARSDARGNAHLGLVTWPGTVRISDARFTNQEITIDTVPIDGLPVTVAAGATLTGKVTLPDGAPATGAVLTLRDASGRLRPATRSVAATTDGTFAFTGLPLTMEFVLFAATTRDGRTWSGQITRARADAPTTIVVRDEDPALVPTDAERGR